MWRAEGQTLSVGALLAVIADPSATDPEVDAFIEKFQSQFTPIVSRPVAGRDANRPGRRDGAADPQRREGEGTPVLLIHGFGGDLLSWLFTQEPLAQGRAVHAFDLPGHGGSAKAIDAGGITDLAAATLAAMDALGLDKAHLVGHSLGGAIAAHLALTQPHRVASASLLRRPVSGGRSTSASSRDSLPRIARAS